MYIDVHCHLDLCVKNKSLSDIVEGAKELGVKRIVGNGVDPKTNRKVLDYARKFPEILPSLGLYPSDALKMSDLEVDEELEFIKSQGNNIVAIGEVGLDFKECVGNSERKRSEEIFIKVIKLAKKMDIPVLVHSRRAEGVIVSILEKMDAKKIVMHMFSGKWSLIKKIIENGWYLSVPGIVRYSEHFQRIAREVPLKNLLCESDSPFLYPIKGHTKFDNEPKNVVVSYQEIASNRGLNLKVVEKEIEENFKSLFKI